MSDVKLPSGGTARTRDVRKLEDYWFMEYFKAFILDAIRRKVDIKAVKKEVKKEMKNVDQKDT